MRYKISPRYTFSGVNNFVDMAEASIEARDELIREINGKSLEPQSCYVCGEHEFDDVSEVDRYGFYYPTGMCIQCGNVQQKSYYDDETLTLFYSRFYRSIYGNSTPKSLFESQRNVNGVKIFEFLKGVSNPKKVLEVGCGAGGILSRYLDIGCEVLGLDFDENYLAYAQKNNIPVKRGSVEQLRFNEKYDLIILSHVLEHIKYPSDFLKKLSNHLTNDGVLYIEVPSLDNLESGGYKYDLLRYLQNAHTIHFTIKSLELMCKRSGYRCIKSTRFIHSCWVKSTESKSISESEKKTSLNYSQDLLSSIEANRNSFRKIFLIEVKSVIRKGLVRGFKLLGIKDIARSIYENIRKQLRKSLFLLMRTNKKYR